MAENKETQVENKKAGGENRVKKRKIIVLKMRIMRRNNKKISETELTRNTKMLTRLDLEINLFSLIT